MTGKEYQQAYQAAPEGRQMREAHRILIGAERAVAKTAASKYYANMVGGSLKLTGEYDAYYVAFDSLQLDHSEVMELAPSYA